MAPTSKSYNGTFLPASSGNSIACYTTVPYNADLTGEKSQNGSSSSNSKASKGKQAAAKGDVNGSDAYDQEVKFIEFDTLNPSRRALTTEIYTIFVSLQELASRMALENDEGHDEEDYESNGGMRLLSRGAGTSAIPNAKEIAYYARFAQLYREALHRHAQGLSSQPTIDTTELSQIQSFRDVFHLASIIYLPSDGVGQSIVSEEILDYLNSTSPYPPTERREALTSTSTPYENPDFWGFIYACILRGHFNLAASVLRSLTSHGSDVLARLTNECLSLLSTLPRSTSPQFAYESAFMGALRAWRGKLSALMARLDIEMDELQEEIEAQRAEDGMDDEDGDGEGESPAEDERYGWQAGYANLLKLLSGDTQTVFDAAEEADGWKSALAGWCMLVRPGMKRDDLPESIEAITSKLPIDTTLFSESIALSLLSGDIPKTLTLASSADGDLLLSLHLSDLFSKLGLLVDSPTVDSLSLRDYFVLSYSDVLMSDVGLWKVNIDYLGWMENRERGEGRIREVLTDIGMGAEVDGESAQEEQGPSEQTGGEKKDGSKTVGHRRSSIKVEDVLEVCANYNLQDVAARICLSAAEALSSRRKYGQAIAYCVQANDPRRVNKICDRILDEYMEKGYEALSLIDAIPTSLLHPSSNSRPLFFLPSEPSDPFSESNDEGAQHAVALLALSTSTRLSFLARYRDFHALYAAGERVAAGELLVLLLSSNSAPQRFWAVMLLDSVALLQASEVVVSEQDTLELMRCLEEIVQPVLASGKDLYGNLEGLTRLASGAEEHGKRKDVKEAEERLRVQAALKQLDVVRFALAQNLSRCFMFQ